MPTLPGRIVIIGAGAVGGVIGCRLHEHGHRVTLVARGRHLESIRANGLRIDSSAGSRTHRIEATDDVATIGMGADDVVVIAVKSQDTGAVVHQLRDAAPDVPVFCAQNGIANERSAIRVFERVYGVFVYVPAGHLAPGVVVSEAGGVSGVLDVGRYPRGTDDICERVSAVLNSSGFSSRPVRDVMRWKHAKLVANVGNALAAFGLPDREAAGIWDLASAEARTCLAAAGLAVASDDEVLQRRAGVSATRLAVSGEPSGNSTWQSLRRGAKSVETDYLNGEIVLLGRLHGTPTPINEALQAAMRRHLDGHPESARAELLGRIGDLTNRMSAATT